MMSRRHPVDELQQRQQSLDLIAGVARHDQELLRRLADANALADRRDAVFADTQFIFITFFTCIPTTRRFLSFSSQRRAKN